MGSLVPLNCILVASDWQVVTNPATLLTALAAATQTATVQADKRGSPLPATSRRLPLAAGRGRLSRARCAPLQPGLGCVGSTSG